MCLLDTQQLKDLIMHIINQTASDKLLQAKLDTLKAAAIHKDLEEQIKIAYELQHQAEKAFLLEEVVLNARDGIMITSANVSEPQIVYVNRAFSQITGYSSEEVIGKTPRILQGEKTDKYILQKLRKCLEAGKPFKGELLNYGKNGREYWLDISIVPIKNREGVVTHFVAIERDVTNRKKELNELIKAAEDAELANKTKSEFLANMSHELRTPMNGIIGMCQLLSGSNLNTEQQELITTLSKSADNLLGLLNDILDISKVESGDLTLEDVPFDIRSSLNEILTLFTPIAASKSLSFEIKVQDNVPQIIMGDPARLQQILRNLISNALKFTHHGGINLNLAIAKQGGATELYFQVKDTGIGVPEDKLEDIFNKFTQADTSITRKYGGTGLGLAITRELVIMMGGRIGVESTLGFGSIFYFSIPSRPAAIDAIPVNLTKENTPTTSNEHINKNLRILAVDDHPINSMFLKKLLNKIGLSNITLAENGIEAINLIEKESFDLIFMDCQMPELDGYQTTRLLRDKKIKTPIIAVTANAMVGDREKCIKCGMDDYISKPIKLDELQNMLNKWSNYHEAIDNHTNATNVCDISNKPVDLEHLRMFTDGNIDEEKELFEVFKFHSDDSVKTLEETIDAEIWRKAAHKLKGSCANLGAFKLSELAKQAELNPLANKPEILAQIKFEYAKVTEFLSKLHA